ncbi:uncharacterized protein B0H18DRAFT_988905 [Fomitopsis serialis]|uniref:uncharacterized protein n=1 Tax=Fomitopsis serialis TaxID=139415 RepID=UPI0020075192|nr:uncharacterized protein B0H18DRAFT_988905 [Neoantrodia serialis]KAH9931960.1 hypothetical protein B0H18DRAFT_988905 [Neoantrodia serialis]
MNVAQLQPPALPQVSERVVRDAGDTEADFLALRLLNKRARVRVSPEQLDLDALPGQARLFALANSKGCFAAVARDASSNWYLLSASLAQLRSKFTSSTQAGEIDFTTQTRHPLPGPATSIAYAHNESRMVVVLADGSIAVYDAPSLLNSSPASPLHVFPANEGASFRKLAPNPGDMPELVAVLRDVGERTDVVAVEVLDIQNMRSVCGWRSGTTPNTKPTAMSWSAKGKLIALGLASGEIEAFSPTAPAVVKTVVPKVQALNEGTIISTTWLSNIEHYCVYTPPGPPSPDAEHTHFVTLFNPKTNALVEVKVNPPALPFPGLRAPGQFIVLFRSWHTARILAFVGDSASSDIGVLAALGEIGTPLHNHWTSLSLEETSQPTVPLDKDMNDTVLVGMEADLTSKEPLRYTAPSGEESDVPAPPVLYIYASDGTIVAWQVVNTKGVAYPGMITPSAVTTSAGGGMYAEPTPTPSTLQAPAMEISTSFGSSSPATASPMAATPSGGATSSGFGFGAFASGATKFGQSSIGFSGNADNGTPSAPAMASPMPSQRPPSPEEETMEADNDAGGGFGGLSLGGGDDTNKNKTSSVFGSFGSPASTENQPAAAFGSSSGGAFSGLKPATGFGAFGSQGASAFGAPSAFSSSSDSSPPSGGAFGNMKAGAGFGAFANRGPSAFGSAPAFSPASTAAPSPPVSSDAKSTSPFGGSIFGQPSTPPKTTAFGQPSTPGQPAFGQASFGKPAFGQSAFGQSAFGKSGFGQSSFGQPASGGSQSSTTTASGFGAFAQASPTGFGAAQPKPDAKPAWAVKAEGGSAAAEAPKPEVKSPASAFGQSSFGQSGFGQSGLGQPGPTQTPSAFGTNANKPSITTSGGFGAFAQAGSSGFGAAASKTDAKPVWAAQSNSQSTTPAEKTKPTPAPTTIPAPTTPPRTPPTPSESRSPTPEKRFEAATPVSSPPSPSLAAAPSSAPTGNAFSQLKASPYGFGSVDSGFGAFGGSVADTSSPFFKAVTKPMDTPAKPAFAAGTSAFSTSPPSAATGANKPVFGAPSPIGGGRSVFGMPSTPSPKATTTPTTTPPSGGAFAAFSGTKSPFGAASSGAKSFSELLRDKTGQELIQPVRPSKTVVEQKKPVSAFAKLPKPSDNQKESDVAESGGLLDDDDINSSEEDEHDDGASFLSDSEDEPDAEGSEEGSEVEEGEEGAKHGEEEEEEEEEDDDDEDDEEEKEKGDAVSSSPVKSPLVMDASKAESGTEHAKLPTLLSRIGPTTAPESKSAPAVVVQREGSTTPPGSPVPAKPASAPPPPSIGLVPPPVVATNLGPIVASNLGRTSTRPIRSSPLASKPISQDDDSSEGGQSPPGTPPSSLKLKAAISAKDPPLLPTFKPATPPAAAPFSLAPPSVTPSAPSAPSTSTPLAPASTSQKAAPFTLGASAAPTLAPKTSESSQPASGILRPRTPVDTSVGASTPPAGQLNVPKSPPSQPSAKGIKLTPPTPTGKLPVVKDLQGECEFLVKYLDGEFTRLLPLTQLAAKRRVELYKAGLNLANLDEANNWRISDLPRLEQLMFIAEKDLAHVQDQLQSYISAIRDMESQLLKASTRKEEVIRFDKVSKDPEFARMLKVRTLGPEHLEAQSQLRREIRAVRERLQQLEGHMQEAKKKLAYMKSGKAALRPPSLSLINGTCNHLEEAIEQNEDAVADLCRRTAHLSLELAPRRSRWDYRITDEDVTRHAEVTPNFAVSTAAALNAEMSANKLKRALLAARKEPLLNTQAISKMPVAQDYVLPEVTAEPQTPPPFDDSFSPDDHSSPPSGHRRLKAGKFHQKPIQLKKSASPTPPPTASFSWGPLPSVTPPAPSKALPFDLRKPSASPSASPTLPSLSASWVTDGFSVKTEGA